MRPRLQPTHCPPSIALLCIILALICAFALKGIVMPIVQQNGLLWVYVGTYTGGGSKGIYLLVLDLESGRLSEPRLVAETVNPSFIAIHPSGRFLYAVNEIFVRQKETPNVSAFQIEPSSGMLKFLNSVPSYGAGPCHIIVDALGRNALVANYGGGSIAVLPIGADGRLGMPTSFIQHTGKGVNPKRQEAPHAHSINLDASNRFALVCDLGLDKIFIYRYDAEGGMLTPSEPPFATVAPGAGPRHLAFHPNGRFVYVINELNSTVTAFSYDAANGSLKEIQTVSTLPKGFSGENTTAEVVVHPSGRFLYGSNRGHDSIAAFSIDQHSGMLTPIGHFATQGRTPRNFSVDPTGKFLLAANQNSNSIVVFRIDQATGELTPSSSSSSVPMPVCIRFTKPLTE
ncbi:MAG: lactonase family protein [Armatimonadota bacterium]|nr:lactonase family protein [Armatimonadota bacterium]